MRYKTVALSLVGFGLIAAAASAQQPAQTARPGAINYVEGAAYIDGQAINPKQIGSIDLNPGQELTTAKGKAEILLTPGVFLRVDDNSAVKLISPDLTLTQVQVDQGRAGVEVDEIHEQNNLQIIDAGITTRLQKTGYYEFDATKPEVMVFKGKADVTVGDNKGKEVKGNHELALNGDNGRALAQEKPASFHENDSTDDLANWSRLRSQYLAEANNQMAPYYDGGGYYPGWYWDPYDYGYTFIGAGPLYSPWGWGFYPFGWYGGGYGWYGHHYYGHGYYGHGRVGVEHGGFAHSGGMGGGGFHGGGGGMHGGGGHGR